MTTAAPFRPDVDVDAMRIRPANAQDAPALATLAARSFTHAFGDSFDADELATVLGETRSETAFHAAMRQDALLLAVLEPRILGYVQFGDMALEIRGSASEQAPKRAPHLAPGPTDQAIHAHYVDPELHGRGVGRALMDAAFAHPRLRRAAQVYIDVWEENARALGFYERYGFDRVGVCPVRVDGEEVGVDLVLRRASRR